MSDERTSPEPEIEVRVVPDTTTDPSLETETNRGGSGRGLDVSRIVLYGVATLLLGGLLYGGLVYEADPDVGTLIGSARVQMRLGMNESALQMVDQALELYPEDAEVHLVAAEAYALSEDYQKARAELKHPSVSRAGGYRGYLIQGFLEDRQEHFGEAVNAYRKALEVIDDEDLQEQVMLGIAEVHFRQKAFRDALAECRKITSRWPDRPRAFGFRAECHRQLSELDAALAAVEQAVSLAPDDAGFAFLHGKIQYEMGNHEAAWASTERAAELDPRSWQARFELARMAAEQGDTERARSALLTAAELDRQAVERELESSRSDGTQTQSLIQILEGSERETYGAPKR
ncbi:MAG: tetratricopeptide repeat protein [Planctomycetota bacterium]